ncbi:MULTISPECIES: nucleoid-associated protein YejK [Gammaproteobacteria]|uniref:nucleoid-associated protein YejK n=1 Tax=Gammaproteobacteria TaxID=1236 RepID=UPI000DD0A451|nr:MULTISPECIES: nucleoid-associated protein YejK [Gammaproteobacteria]RTE87169.1 nucleoid-associated protein YejK [Aliidiomarina sp. B3213]TCZ93043.1 nucleoid-associated protein YejK [Lysobacter sp. N42]
MKLSITSSVVHHLFQDNDGQFGLRLSPQLLEETGDVLGLLEELTRVYNAKPAKGYARFIEKPSEDSESEDNIPVSSETSAEQKLPFQTLVDSWLAEETNFLDFSQEAARLLKNEIADYGVFESGFLLMADYEQTADRYLLVSFIPVREGVMVQPDLSVDRSAQLDVNKLQLAARINLTELAANVDGMDYISFIRGRAGRKVADFFLDFLGCAEQLNAKKTTESLVKTVQSYVSDNELPRELGVTLQKDVFDYCGEQWQQGEKVKVDDIEERFGNHGAPSLKEYTQTKDVTLPQEFPADKTALRGLVKFQGQGGGLSVAFEQKMLGERVQYDPATDTLTITGTPPNLREQLKRFYGQND